MQIRGTSDRFDAVRLRNMRLDDHQVRRSAADVNGKKPVAVQKRFVSEQRRADVSALVIRADEWNAERRRKQTLKKLLVAEKQAAKDQKKLDRYVAKLEKQKARAAKRRKEKSGSE